MSEGISRMYKNKYGLRNNIAGINIGKIRKAHVPRMSQRALAEQLQLAGLDLDKNAIQRIESGERFITDIELLHFAKVFEIEIKDLFE